MKTLTVQLSPWRNGLAHWTSNSKVVGSSPTGDALFFFSSYVLLCTRFFSGVRLTLGVH